MSKTKKKLKKLPVLLLKDYPNLGQQGEVVMVKPGYFRYLVENKIATLATEERLKGELRGKTLKEKVEIRKSLAEETKENLEKNTFEIKLPRDPKSNKIFGSITNEKIAKMLAKHNFKIKKSQIKLDKKITEPGLYTIPISLGYNIEARISLKVI